MPKYVSISKDYRGEAAFNQRLLDLHDFAMIAMEAQTDPRCKPMLKKLKKDRRKLVYRITYYTNRAKKLEKSS